MYQITFGVWCLRIETQNLNEYLSSIEFCTRTGVKGRLFCLCL